MLVLSRKAGEFIDIKGGFANGGITIMVVRIDGDKCRLGITAPMEMPVHRREVRERIEREEGGDGK